MPRRRHRPEPAELITIAESAKLLGVSLPTTHRWDESGRFPTRCHPINSYRVCLRDRAMRLRKNTAETKRAA
ncbi:hypothetical protein WMF37_18935 [Sorangium sp. So ce291]|uniref:MerR family DNA-binding transcriptional regulator n=1 Tax=Sorangium sp. So ce291 TaxID=3133294 RepID=UPI003F6039D8